MKSGLRIRFNAPVVLLFVAACFVATLLGYVTQDASTTLLFATYRYSLTSPLTYIRLFTHVLGHSGWEHFFGNMTFILLLGPMLEEKYGSLRLLCIIAASALATGLFSNLIFSNAALCGASGVVFCFIILSSITGIRRGEIPLTFILVAIIYLGGEVYNGLVLRDDIANSAHIIGGIVGGGCGFALNRKDDSSGTMMKSFDEE